MTTTHLDGTTSLRPGEVLRIAVDAGHRLLVVQGSATVTAPPSWLGETLSSMQAPVHEGEVWVAGQGGWIEVLALTPVLIRGITLPTPAAAGASLVGRFVQLLTGRTA